MRRRVLVGRIVGAVLVFDAAAALFVELYRWGRDGVYQVIPVGELWATINANSLVGFGAMVEQKISPWLWIEIIVPLLTLPTWLVLIVPGGLLLWLCRQRKRRPIFRKR